MADKRKPKKKIEKLRKAYERLKDADIKQHTERTEQDSNKPQAD